MTTSRRHFLTGATGLLGSHIAERLVQRGEHVRALVRSTSDTTFLRALGVEPVVGDLRDAESLVTAVSGTDIVYHCAAKVGDWGTRREFQETIVDATANVLRAAKQSGVSRVVYVSSVQVYGHVQGTEVITEDEPLGQNLSHWEKYARAKMAAEALCRDHPGEVTILRPSWIYGPRDRQSICRIINGLRVGRMGMIDDGSHRLNLIYAGDVAEAAILAAETPAAAGGAYNLTSPGEISQRDWFRLITEQLGLPPVVKSVPKARARWLGWLSELVGTVIRMKRSPYITRYGVGLMLRPTRYSNERAETDLGWHRAMPIEEGMRMTLQWYRDHVEPSNAADDTTPVSKESV